jgi:prepilin-type N-terminal cleavage/methylation domain-containing protein/prepilin-type processing-associated H-X9-DG protein
MQTPCTHRTCGRPRDRLGFTLIEVLVVVALVALLIGLLVPALGQARRSARQVTCRSNLHQWGLAWAVYTQENKGFFSDGAGVGWARGEWFQALRDEYRRKPQLLACPEAKLRRGPGTQETSVGLDDPSAVEYGGPHTMYLLPVDDPTVTAAKRQVLASYGANDWIYAAQTDIQGRKKEWHWGRMDAPPKSSITPLFGDTMWRGGGPHHDNARPAYSGEWKGYDAEFNHFAIQRHGRGIHLAFFDGSARHVRARHLWRLTWNRQFDVTYADKQGDAFFPAWMR